MTTFTSTEEQMFLDFLRSNGHPLDSNINYDSSKFHYLPCPHGGKTDARYKFYSDGIASGYLKCWHCGVEDDFCSKQKKDVSPQEWKAHSARLKEAKQQEALETKKRYEEQAQLARTVFSSAAEVTSDEQGYLSKKRVQSYGLRIIKEESEHTNKAKCYLGTLLVPCYNANNELVNLERIYLDVSQNKYQKRPLSGAERSGAFYMLGTVTSETQTILVAEGYSSAATLYEAVGYPTVITFNCGNIPSVVKVLREMYLKAHILIVADDDCWQDDEFIKFAGERAAKKACAQNNNVSYVLPDFSVLGLPKEKLARQPSPPTDFNDLFTSLMDKGLSRPEALKEIARQVIPAPIPHSEVLGKLINKVSAINFREYASLNDDADLRNNHYQIIVVEHLMAIAKANHWGICKNIDFTYLFNGAYWNLLDENDLKIFLGNAAEKMGVERYKARYFNFKEHLYKQFLSSAHLPKPETPTENICVNLKNGTFEFTQERLGLKGFDSNDFLTYQLPFEFRPEATAPLFNKYMEKVLPEKQLQDILAEFIGYIFIPNGMLKLEKMLLLYGGGANGKSVFYEVIKSLLGEINISAHSLQSLTDDTGYYRAMIANKLVNYGSELSGGLASSVFKQLSSGEPVEARLPYGKPFTISNYAKLIFNCNELPKDVEHSEAYFRRFLIIPFEITIPEKEQDKQLAQKIISQELSGVFNWVLEGLKRLLKNKNFTESDTVKRVRAQYELESDSVKTFLLEKNYKAHTKQYVMLGSLYDEYKQFCFDDGFKPLNKTNFRKRLEASKYEVKRQNIGLTVSVQKEREQTNYSYQEYKNGET